MSSAMDVFEGKTSTAMFLMSFARTAGNFDRTDVERPMISSIQRSHRAHRHGAPSLLSRSPGRICISAAGCAGKHLPPVMMVCGSRRRMFGRETKLISCSIFEFHDEGTIHILYTFVCDAFLPLAVVFGPAERDQR